jgi:hypothetical protein
MIETPFDEDGTGPAKPFPDIWTKAVDATMTFNGKATAAKVYFAVNRDEFWTLAEDGTWKRIDTA